MKNKFVYFILISLLYACGTGDDNKPSENGVQDHTAHNDLRDNFSHQGIVLLPVAHKTNEELKERFQNILNAYLNVSGAVLSETDVDSAIEEMINEVQKINPSEFSDKASEAWKQHQELYLKNLSEMKHIAGMDDKRAYLGHLSEIIYCTLKSFEFNTVKIYVNFCADVFDNNGAYWISTSKEIENPYGDAYKECGKHKEIINVGEVPKIQKPQPHKENQMPAGHNH